MPKLTTPIIFESALDILNRVHPLQLTDEGRICLDYPLLCKNPVGIGNPCIGKLARCDEQGSVLKHIVAGFTNYELHILDMLECANPAEVIFSQKVFVVICLVACSETDWHLYITDNTYTNVIKDITVLGVYPISFGGYKMYFKGGTGGEYDMVVWVSGFY
jgi:hypothetical protein